MSEAQVPYPATEGPKAGRAAPGVGLAPWIAAGLEVMRRQAWLIAIMLGYIAFGMALGRWYGLDVNPALYGGSMLWLYLVFAAIALTARSVSLLRTHKPAVPLAFLAADFRTFYLAPHRFLTPLPVLILMPSFHSVFSSIKRLIPHISPFSWDRDFSDLDRLIHGGTYPWEYLQPFLGSSFATRLVSEFYTAPWLVMVILMQFWLTFTASPERQRLLLTYVLTWIVLGNGAAIAFSSAGPVYYEHFVAGANPYGVLMAFLTSIGEQAPLSALTTQDYLWSLYMTGNLAPGAGISAMPSLHLSMGTLLVLAVRRLDRRVLALALVYLAFLEIGSVHLGWHYAIDGYAGIAGTLALWWALGRILPSNKFTREQRAG